MLVVKDLRNGGLLVTASFAGFVGGALLGYKPRKNAVKVRRTSSLLEPQEQDESNSSENQ